MNSELENDSDETNGINYEASGTIGFFRRLVHSCYNPNFFVLPLQEKFTRTLFYLIKLLLIVVLLQAATTGYLSWRIGGNISRNLKEQLPEMKFHNGALTTRAQTPASLDLYENYKLLLDPEGERNRARLSPEFLIVAVDGGLFVRRGEDYQYLSTKFYSADDQAPEITIDTATLERWLPTIRIIFLLTTLLVVSLELIFITGVRTLLISFGGMIGRSQEPDSPGLSRLQVLRISCYAITPVALAHTLVFITGLNIPYLEFFLLLGGTLWTFTIVTTLRGKSSPDVDEKPDEDNEQKEESESYWDRRTRDN